MCKKNKCLVVLILIFTLSGGLFAQSKKIKKANAAYKSMSYRKASKLYLELIENGVQSTEILQNLGNSYYFNSNFKEAEKWYNVLFDLEVEIKDIYYLRYARCLEKVSKNELAMNYFDEFSKKIVRDSLILDTKERINTEKVQEVKYFIYPLNFNSKGVDFGGQFYDGKFIFSSDKKNVSKNKRRSFSDDENFLSLFEVTVNDNGSYGGAKEFKLDVSTKFHQSTAVFTKDGNTMYFTSNNIKKKDDVGELRIYRASLVDNEWTDIEDLSINDEAYSVSHPALSNDEKTLYFSSDMPGSYGDTDIYKVIIKEDNSFGVPENLGTTVNTSAKESFPFISTDNMLYFASDGHFGLGDLDVFCVNLSNSLFEQKPVNLDKPINSPYDDYGFMIRDDKGFVSSNRFGGMGKDDIYAFQVFNQEVCDQEVCDQEDFTLQSSIYFDLDKAIVTSSAKIVLNELVEIMKEQPNLKVHFKVYADSRGSDKYNFNLSDRRVNSVINYMMSYGIDVNRFVFQIFGETELTNGCYDGKDCVEEEHELNRRLDVFYETDM